MIYRIVKAIMWAYLHLLNRTDVVGAENIPRDGALVIYANHVTILDVFLLGVTFERPISFMAKKELFSVPVVRRFVKAMYAFPVNRGTADIGAIKNAMRVLKDGGQFGIFPEGTRSHGGTQAAAKGGVALIAHKCQATCLPVHLCYKRKLCIFNRYTVKIGDPVAPEALALGDGARPDYEKAGAALMEKVYAL